MATIKFKLTEESPAHFIALANRTIEDLGWKVLGYSEKSLAASIGHSEYQSAYSNLRIVIQSNEVTLTCHNDLVIIAEESRNSSYLTRFLSHYEYTKQRTSERELWKMANKIHETNIPLPTLNFYKIDSFKGFLRIFIPSRLFFVTTIILDINIVVYVALLASSFFLKNDDQQMLITMGANFKPLVLEGEWWRFFSAIFIHDTFSHILMNTLMLFYIGSILEPITGHLRFAINYIITGFFANLMSFYLTDYTLTIGASGAIFGLLGVFLGMITSIKMHSEMYKHIIANVVAITLATPVNGLFKGSVNHVAHFSGLICGAVLTIIHLQIDNNKSDKNSVENTAYQ